MDGPACPDPAADVGRGDVEGPDGNQEYPEAGEEVFSDGTGPAAVAHLPRVFRRKCLPGPGQVEPRPADDDEAAFLQHFPVRLPGLDLQEGIDSQDEKDPGVRIDGLEVVQCDDGVRLVPGPR